MNSMSRYRLPLLAGVCLALTIGIALLWHAVLELSDRTYDIGQRLGRIETSLESVIEKRTSTSPTVAIDDSAKRRAEPQGTASAESRESYLSEPNGGLLLKVLDKLEAISDALERSNVAPEVQPDFSKPKDMFRLEAIANRLESERTQVLKEHAFVRLSKLYELYGTPDDMGASRDSTWWSYTMRDGRRIRFVLSAGAVADIEHN